MELYEATKNMPNTKKELLSARCGPVPIYNLHYKNLFTSPFVTMLTAHYEHLENEESSPSLW